MEQEVENKSKMLTLDSKDIINSYTTTKLWDP